jgi:DNA-binding XRE family transcriptional regulator
MCQEINSMPNLKKTIGKRIGCCINDDPNTSIESLSKLMGLHRDTIQKWIAGKSLPRHKTAESLSTHFNKPSGYFQIVDIPEIQHKGRGVGIMGAENRDMLKIIKYLSKTNQDLAAANAKLVDLIERGGIHPFDSGPSLGDQPGATGVAQKKIKDK